MPPNILPAVTLVFTAPAKQFAEEKRNGSYHFFRVDPLSELLIGHQTQFNGGLPEGFSFLMCLFGNFGGVFVPYMGVQGCDEHEGIFEMFLDYGVVGFDTGRAVVGK